MKKKDLLLIVEASLLLTGLSVGTLFTPDQAFSEYENRFLNDRPALTKETLINGRFADQMEDYLTDQIVGRQKWISAVSSIKAGLGTSDINGVYLCKDHRAVQRLTDSQFNWTQYDKNMQQIKSFLSYCSQQQIPADLMLIPTDAYVYRHQLPPHALCFDEDKAFSMAEDTLSTALLDLRESLCSAAQNNTHNVFFKTDHHWTGYGAFLAYQDYCKRLFLKVPSQYKADALSTDFQGTLYSKVLLSSLGTDTIETPQSALSAEYVVTIDGKSYNSLYFKEHLSRRDQYAVYFGGNFGRIDITQKAVQKGQRLLILKDSFANSFVPYLLADFEHITMVDTRYYTGDISELAEDYDKVLLLYQVSSLSEQKLRLSGALLQ